MKPHMNRYAAEAQATILGVPRSMWGQFGIRAMPTLKAYNAGKQCPALRGRDGRAFKSSLDNCGGGSPSPSPSPRPPPPRPPPPPPPPPSSGNYKRVNGMYLGGYAARDGRKRNEAQSRTRCDQLGSQCGGYTCRGGSCTVRASKHPRRSPSGEYSYVKGSGPAPRPSPRPPPSPSPSGGGSWDTKGNQFIMQNNNNYLQQCPTNRGYRRQQTRAGPLCYKRYNRDLANEAKQICSGIPQCKAITHGKCRS